jgi:hypothetical protein
MAVGVDQRRETGDGKRRDVVGRPSSVVRRHASPAARKPSCRIAGTLSP